MTCTITLSLTNFFTYQHSGEKIFNKTHHFFKTVLLNDENCENAINNFKNNNVDKDHKDVMTSQKFGDH